MNRPLRCSMYGLMFLGVFMLAFLGIIHAPVAEGIGVSPAMIVLDDLRPGTKTARNINFSRETATQPARLVISIEGPVAQHFSAPKELTMDAHQQSVVLPITIDTGSLSTGSYEAVITGAETAPHPSGTKEGGGTMGATSTVVTAAQARVKFTVSNIVKEEFSIRQVILPESEEGQPLGFSYLLANTGNVDVRPTKIDLSLALRDDPEKPIYTETIAGDTLTPIAAQTEKEVFLLTKAALSVENYAATILIYQGERIVFELKNHPVQIFPAGTLAQKGALVSFAPDKEHYEKNELVVLNAVFKNEGDVGLTIALVADITKNNERVDLLKTDQTFVPPRRIADLSMTTRQEKSGDYHIKAFVNYGIHKSNEIETQFTIKGLNIIVVIGAIGGLVFLIALVGIAFSRLRRRKQPASSNEQSAESPQ